jgi:hypothetical protein
MKSTYSATNTFTTKSLNLNNQEEGSSHITPNSTNSCFWRQKWPGMRLKSSCRSTTNKRRLCLSDHSVLIEFLWISVRTLLKHKKKLLTSNNTGNNSDLWYFIVFVFLLLNITKKIIKLNSFSAQFARPDLVKKPGPDLLLV